MMMPRKKPRSRVEIYADIMLAIDRMGTCDRLSRLAMMVGVPYDRLLRYLNEMKRLGLVRWGPYHGVYLTADGMDYIINAQGNRDRLAINLASLIQGSVRTSA